MEAPILYASPLSAAAFAPFGDVIAMNAATGRWINEGTCQRYDDLAAIDVLEDAGRPLVSIFRAQPRALPLPIRLLERHPLSSQAFYPLERRAFLVVVAEAGSEPITARVRVFYSTGEQGVNYRRNTWHHPLIALQEPSDFLVIDRGGPGVNCEELHFAEPPVRVALP